MRKFETFNEVIEALKSKEIVMKKDKSIFVLKSDKIYHHFKSSRIILRLEDFIELYSEEEFYLYEDESCIIDNLKDQEYYGFKHK